MATIITPRNHYKVIRMNIEEMLIAFPGTLCICDDSNVKLEGHGFYIPILNSVYCEKSYKEWKDTASFHIEDVHFEDRNANRVLTKLNNYYKNI